jgi:hypothetical protein
VNEYCKFDKSEIEKILESAEDIIGNFSNTEMKDFSEFETKVDELYKWRFIKEVRVGTTKKHNDRQSKADS